MELEWRDLAFHREIGAVIEALDSAQFWTRLTRALERYVGFDNWVALRFTPRGRRSSVPNRRRRTARWT